MLLLDSLRSLVPSTFGRAQYGYFNQKCPDESASSVFCTTNPDGRATPNSCANSWAHLFRRAISSWANFFWRTISLWFFHKQNNIYTTNPTSPRRNMSSPIEKRYSNSVQNPISFLCSVSYANMRIWISCYMEKGRLWAGPVLAGIRSPWFRPSSHAGKSPGPGLDTSGSSSHRYPVWQH